MKITFVLTLATDRDIEYSVNILFPSILQYFELNDLDKIRNEMLIMDFPIEKIEPSLGGMLRVIHAMKKAKNKYKISPRLKAYFRERLELESYHIDYIMKKSKKIAQIN